MNLPAGLGAAAAAIAAANAFLTASLFKSTFCNKTHPL
jgi:hypothetical protein